MASGRLHLQRRRPRTPLYRFYPRDFTFISPTEIHAFAYLATAV
jgi:alkyl hydroperoxide reductase subunit AhpC